MDIVNAVGLRHDVNSTSTSPEKPCIVSQQNDNQETILSPESHLLKDHKQLDEFAVMPKYHNILRELVHTERDYCKDLAGIIDGYQKQLQGKLTEQESGMIFGNIADLYEFHNELSARVGAYVDMCPHMIGEVFVAMGLERFMVYERYYLDHTKSLSILLQKQEEPAFLGVLIRCQSRLGHQLPLADYLLKPVQRLLKYPLLLSEMLKAMSPESTGYPSLLAAKQLLKDVADNINELKRRLDVSKYVESLQKRLLGWNGPDLVTFGQLKDAGDFKVSDSSNKKSNRQVLLFEYGILICKPRSAGFVSVKHHFKMDDLYLQTMLNEQLCFRLTVADNKKVYFTFYCKTQDDKQYWIAKIKKVIIDFHTGIGRRARDAHTLANRRRSSDVTTKPPIAPKPKVSAKPDSHEHHRRLFSRPGPRKRFSAADSLGMASMDHAPVSKKKEDDLVLNYNPYAQAGGFTGEKQEVKQFLRRQTSARVSRKLDRRRHSHQVELDTDKPKRDSATSDTGSFGGDAGLRPCTSTLSDDSGASHHHGGSAESADPDTEGGGAWSHAHRCSTASDTDGTNTPLLDVGTAHRISTASDSSGGSCSNASHRSSTVSDAGGPSHRGTPAGEGCGGVEGPGPDTHAADGAAATLAHRPAPFTVVIDDHDDVVDDMLTPTATAELAFAMPTPTAPMPHGHTTSARQAGKAPVAVSAQLDAAVGYMHPPSTSQASHDGMCGGVAVSADEACVVRVAFPDGSHASVIVKAGDTVRKAFASRLFRRGLQVSECIVQIPALPHAAVGWDADALMALHGHTSIHVTKVKSTVDVPRPSGVVRMPSGHTLCLDSVTGSGVVASPAKLTPRPSVDDDADDAEPTEPVVEASLDADERVAQSPGDGSGTPEAASPSKTCGVGGVGSDPYNSHDDDDDDGDAGMAAGGTGVRAHTQPPGDAGGGEDLKDPRGVAPHPPSRDVSAPGGADGPAPVTAAALDDHKSTECGALDTSGPIATSSPTLLGAASPLSGCHNEPTPGAGSQQAQPGVTSHVSVYVPTHGPKPHFTAFRPEFALSPSSAVHNPLLAQRLAQFDPAASPQEGDPNTVTVPDGNGVTTVRLRPRKHSAPAALTKHDKEGSKRVRSNDTTPPVPRRRISSGATPVPAPRRHTISTQPVSAEACGTLTGTRMAQPPIEAVATIKRNSRIFVNRWENADDGALIPSASSEIDSTAASNAGPCTSPVPPAQARNTGAPVQPTASASAVESADASAGTGTDGTAPANCTACPGTNSVGTASDGVEAREKKRTTAGNTRPRPTKVRTGGALDTTPTAREPKPTPRQRRTSNATLGKIKRTASQRTLARRNPSLQPHTSSSAVRTRLRGPSPRGVAGRKMGTTKDSGTTQSTGTKDSGTTRSTSTKDSGTTRSTGTKDSDTPRTPSTKPRSSLIGTRRRSSIQHRESSSKTRDVTAKTTDRKGGVLLPQPRTPRHTDV